MPGLKWDWGTYRISVKPALNAHAVVSREWGRDGCPNDYIKVFVYMHTLFVRAANALARLCSIAGSSES